MMNPMMGNLTYLHVALMSAVHGGLELFVYHDDTEYDDGDVLTTNYWKYLAEFHHYSHFGIAAILTVTQILSMVGVAGEINIMAWMYMEMVEMVIALVLKTWQHVRLRVGLLIHSGLIQHRCQHHQG